MSTRTLAHASLIDTLRDHLKAEGYSCRVQRHYPVLAAHFLDYCTHERLAPEAVRLKHVTEFLQRRYRLYQKQHREAMPFRRWCWRYTGAIHALLRLVHGRWPVADPPASALEAFHCDILHDYHTWLCEVRGLHALTCARRRAHALQFLGSLGSSADQEGVVNLSVCDIDAYLKRSCEGLRRTSIEDRTVSLRDFLRHLWRSGRTATDLSATVLGPRIYEHENIPSALLSEEVERVLAVSREDSSPIGLRDHAILMLLATYGLRAGELVKLRLEDIDWRREVVRVHHSKIGAYSVLPLLNEVGEALLRYLQQGRPVSKHRELFLRIQAPHRPFKCGATLNCVTRGRLKAAGVTPQGRQGPHAFRHARAVSLLHRGVPLNVIGEVLGHTSAASTGIYLKLATQDLRAVGLELPRGLMP